MTFPAFAVRFLLAVVAVFVAIVIVAAIVFIVAPDLVRTSLGL
jgi:hypothetical protein